MDVELEVYRRNARFRAWVSQGVPVGGGWAREGMGGLRLRLSCTNCNASASDECHPATMERCEVNVLDWLLRSHGRRAFRKRPCRMWYFLRDATRDRADPPEVLAIWELELLAGDTG